MKKNVAEFRRKKECEVYSAKTNDGGFNSGLLEVLKWQVEILVEYFTLGWSSPDYERLRVGKTRTTLDHLFSSKNIRLFAFEISFACNLRRSDFLQLLTTSLNLGLNEGDEEHFFYNCIRQRNLGCLPQNTKVREAPDCRVTSLGCLLLENVNH